MRKLFAPRLWRVAMVLIVLVFAGSSAAGANPRYAAIVVDAATGEVVFSRQADATRYPASLTKMMTLYLTFEAIERGRLRWDEALPVSRHAASMPPSRLGLSRGSSILVRDAVLALVTKSANDIAVVLGEAIGGTESEFAEIMTAKARSLGMTSTTFRNASGLPNSRQRTTARDMARLGLALWDEFPDEYELFGTKRFAYGGRSFSNNNRLLGRVRGVDGIKTGYIHASGYNLVSSASRDGRRIVAVVLGGRTGQSRDNHMAELIELGFERVPQVLVLGPPVPNPRTPSAALVAKLAPGAGPAVPAAVAAVGGSDESAAAFFLPRPRPELEIAVGDTDAPSIGDVETTSAEGDLSGIDALLDNLAKLPDGAPAL